MPISSHWQERRKLKLRNQTGKRKNGPIGIGKGFMWMLIKWSEMFVKCPIVTTLLGDSDFRLLTYITYLLDYKLHNLWSSKQNCDCKIAEKPSYHQRYISPKLVYEQPTMDKNFFVVEQIKHSMRSQNTHLVEWHQ